MAPIILLQGPPGGFFGYLARHLDEVGFKCSKVHFNRADEILDRFPNSVTYSGATDDLVRWYQALFRAEEPRAVILYEDLRPRHRIAVEVANRLNIPVFVFAEGYMPPNFVTFECGGTHARSRFRHAPLSPPADVDLPQPTRFRGRIAARIKNTSQYLALTKMGGSPKPSMGEGASPNARPRGMGEAAGKWFNGALKALKSRSANHQTALALAHYHEGEYYVLALQESGDPQLRAGSAPWTNETLIPQVISSFATDAPPNTLLAVKQAPTEIGSVDWTPLITQAALAYDVGDRVFSLTFAPQERLLNAARAVVTVNSFVGVKALHEGCPVFCLGPSVYDRHGLASHGTLNELTRFWRNCGTVNTELAERFWATLLIESQVNADFNVRSSWPFLCEKAEERIMNELSQREAGEELQAELAGHGVEEHHDGSVFE